MAAGRTKYTIEAFSMMCLMYSRFTNTSELPHQNIAEDLHIEPLNWVVKTAVSHWKTEKSIIRAQKCVHYLHFAVQKFDITSTPSSSGRHRRACDKDRWSSIFPHYHLQSLALQVTVYQSFPMDLCECTTLSSNCNVIWELFLGTSKMSWISCLIDWFCYVFAQDRLTSSMSISGPTVLAWHG